MNPKENLICVVGSSIVDFTIRLPKLPTLGETILGNLEEINLGGKGANQAVGLARLGSKVVFVTCLGNDNYSHSFKEKFRDEKIIDCISISETKLTGLGIPLLLESGENSIIVSPGAALELKPVEVEKCFEQYNNIVALLIQFEIPERTILTSLQIARSKGVTTIVNPAPIMNYGKELLQLTDILIPNKHEVENLSGVKVNSIDSAFQAADVIKKYGVKTVVVTLGSEGVIALTNSEKISLPSVKIDVADTTGAGDSFCAGFTYGITEGMSIRDALLFANSSAALCCSKIGALPAMPYKDDVVKLMQRG